MTSSGAMTDNQQTDLQEWLSKVAADLDLGLTVNDELLHILLDLARDAAHNVLRPAAPLTTFLVGVAVGRGQSLGAAAARATELCLQEGSDQE